MKGSRRRRLFNVSDTMHDRCLKVGIDHADVLSDQQKEALSVVAGAWATATQVTNTVIGNARAVLAKYPPKGEV